MRLAHAIVGGSAMTDEWKPTSVWDALLIELLLGLSMSQQGD